MYKTVKDRKIRIGIVGCGRISKNHFGSIEKHKDNMELAAVCDTDSTVLARHEEQYRVNGYHDLEDMLAREKLDIVAICTPSGIHPDQTITVAKAGIHVIT
ncbi:MAG TPA: gfo/Idh/MocA family oxidoreductase, partial [Chromatiales bacterium]|nr:gfo/Idh/MocA family oxidoreductase [Chromatiales bacterium]